LHDLYFKEASTPSPSLTMPAKKKPNPDQHAADWRTTDELEIHRRVQRAIEEKHSVTNLTPEHPVFSNFAVRSPTGMTYEVEIRNLTGRSFSCTCPDFRTNGMASAPASTSRPRSSA
jgi:hypothetical protein